MLPRRSARRGNSPYTAFRSQRPGRDATIRFSSTLSEGKISRSCATQPSPLRARQCAPACVISRPRQMTAPRLTRVKPMMVRSSVDLPTPLRPRMARLPPSGTAIVMPSSTTASPYPARTSSSASSASAMARPAQIDVAHAHVGGDFPRRALYQDPPAPHQDKAMRKTKSEIHGVLDEQHGDVAGEMGDDRKQLGALAPWHARRGLIQQQHLRLGGECERYLQQPLLAIGELAGRPIAARSEPQRNEDRMRLLDRIAIGRQLPPPTSGVALPLADRKRHRLERAEVGKQRIDLKGAHEAAFDALLGLERRDVVFAKENMSPVRPEHAGHEIDQRRFAGAVRSDQRITLALRQFELDVLGDDERAEALIQAARGQGRGVHARLRTRRVSRVNPPRMPFGRNRTTAMSSVPIQKYQYCGLMPEN